MLCQPTVTKIPAHPTLKTSDGIKCLIFSLSRDEKKTALKLPGLSFTLQLNSNDQHNERQPN